MSPSRVALALFVVLSCTAALAAEKSEKCACSAADKENMEIERRQSTNTIDALKTQISTSEKEGKLLADQGREHEKKFEEQVKQRETDLARVKEAETDLARVKEAKALMEAKLEQAEKKANELQTQAEKEANELQTQLKTANQEREENAGTSEKTISALRTQITSLQEGKALADQGREHEKKLEEQVKERETDLARVKEAKAFMKTKLEQAEIKANKLQTQLKTANQEQEENAGTSEKSMSALRAQIASLQTNISSSAARLSSAEQSLAGNDVQALLTLRQASIEGLAVMQGHASTAYGHASTAYEHASVAFAHSRSSLEGASVHYDTATEEATRMYNKAAPVLAESHKQVMEAAAPHVEMMKGHFNFGLNFLTEKLQSLLREGAKSVPAIAPHVDLTAKIGAHLIILSVPALILFLIVCGVVRRLSLLLLKLEYALLFVLMGAVLAFSSLAFVTQQDPIAQLRTTAPDTYESTHMVLGCVGVLLSFIQFSVLLSKAKCGGKGVLEQGMTLISAVMTVVLFLHYYNLVFKKAAKDPSFSMAFAIKGDGTASFAEYSIFACAVVLTNVLGTASSFRFSASAILMALEGVIAGFCFALITLGSTLKDPLGTLLKVQYAPEIMGGVAALLGFMLLARALLRVLRITTGYGLFFALAHLFVVAGVLYHVGEIPFNNFMTGSSDTLAETKIQKCGGVFIVLLIMQVLGCAYAATPPAPTNANLLNSKAKKQAETTSRKPKSKKS